MSYEIQVPRRSGLDLKAHNGGIGISDVEGDITFEALNGGVTLNRLGGDVEGKTVNGGLKVEWRETHGAATRWMSKPRTAASTSPYPRFTLHASRPRPSTAA